MVTYPDLQVFEMSEVPIPTRNQAVRQGNTSTRNQITKNATISPKPSVGIDRFSKIRAQFTGASTNVFSVGRGLRHSKQNAKAKPAPKPAKTGIHFFKSVNGGYL